MSMSRKEEIAELTNGLTNEDLDVLFDFVHCTKAFGSEFINAVNNAEDKISIVQEFKQRLLTVGASS